MWHPYRESRTPPSARTGSKSGEKLEEASEQVGRGWSVSMKIEKGGSLPEGGRGGGGWRMWAGRVSARGVGG